MARKIADDVQKAVIEQVIDAEYTPGQANQDRSAQDFDSYIDLLDSVREPKNYEWMSDISLPEFASRYLTQQSIDANQYFKQREFVTAYLEDTSDEAVAAADAATECINRTLNQRHLNHYHKFIRAKGIASLAGRVFLRCKWEQQMRKVVTGFEDVEEQITEPDDLGNPVLKTVVNKKPVTGEEPLIDRFNYDVLLPRQVVCDNKYVYSLQEKDWVDILDEESYEELKADESDMGYINLDQLSDMEPPYETELSRETYNKGDQQPRYEKPRGKLNKRFNTVERHGKFWAIVKTRDIVSEDPIDIVPGIDAEGKIKSGSEFIECVLKVAWGDGKRVLIRFQPQAYIDAYGNPYRPIIRALCYIHPTDDAGVGDGKYSRELQIAMDDTFNVSSDRVLLATLPTLVAAKGSGMENDTLRIEPMHVIREETQKDVRVLEISDNIQGALNQIGFLSQSMDKIQAIFPTTMGQLPGASSTTATAVASSGNQANARSNYKSLTFENTGLCELYWMDMMMTWQFAKPETGVKLMGDKVFKFNPRKDYFFKPVSESIETEFARAEKRKELATILGYIMQSGNPKTAELANQIITRIFELMGDEEANFAKKLFNPQQPVTPPGGGQPQPGVQQPAMSNQSGIPQSAQEIAMRSANAG